MEEERRGEFVNRRMGRMTGGQVGGAGRAVQSGLPPSAGTHLDCMAGLRVAWDAACGLCSGLGLPCLRQGE